MGESRDPESELPIDISFSKFSDWLVDRKRLPSDWRKRLLPIRAKIASALTTLPRDLNPWFANLTIEDTGYLEAKQVLEILTVAKPEARTLFGRLSGVAGEWDAIVRAYEKDFLFLGEAAQIMIQNVNYEIPYFKKQITKIHQQLGDLERKETEYKRNASAAAVKYQQACQELGVKGTTNIRAELLETSKTLHGILAEVEEVLCNEIVGQAVECYQAFVSYASNNDNILVVPRLKAYRDKHSEVMLSESCVSEKDTSAASICDVQHEVNVDSPQRSVSAETSYAAKEEVDANINGHIDNAMSAVGLLKDQQLEEERHMDSSSDQNRIRLDDHLMANIEGGIDWDTGEFSVSVETEIDWDTQNTRESGIDWDITIEDTSGLDTNVHSLSLESCSQYVKQERIVIANKLMDTEFRTTLLDDLLEIRTFLVLRIEEINREETSSLQNQVQAISPEGLQQYGTDSFNRMSAEISKAINLLTNKRHRDLIMMITSERFLKRLEASLNQKKQQESKFLDSIRDIHQKQLDLRNTLAAIWPKQEAALRRTREIKENCEKTISAFHEGRKINIIGEINSILGQS